MTWTDYTNNQLNLTAEDKRGFALFKKALARLYEADRKVYEALRLIEEAEQLEDFSSDAKHLLNKLKTVEQHLTRAESLARFER